MLDADNFAELHRCGAIDEGEFGVRPREILPDELEHEELVEIGVEQRSRNGIHLPVMVVRSPCEIDNHDEFTLNETRGCGKRGSSQ